MENRRKFLQASAGALIANSARGANDRVQMAIIGTGGRGNQVFTAFSQHTDQVFLAACDVANDRLDAFVSTHGKMDTYGDYRRVLDRKDIDAVLITVPDHQHLPILQAALSAGKDVYVEKPISNSLEPAQKMVDAVHRSDRVVQVGLQQRSWPHFQECARLIQDGYIGTVRQSVIYFGNYMRVPEVDPPTAVPAALDWDGWLGPASHKPYAPSRQRSWRAYYDYGGGMITDWGVHLVDVEHWYLNADRKGPAVTTTVSGYLTTSKPDREQTPDTFSIVWQYDNYMATFTNTAPAALDGLTGTGNYFYGDKGVLLVNRSGYRIFPTARGMGGGRAVAGRAGAGQPGQPPANVPPPPPPIEARRGDGGTDATPNHTRNFLDCVKSRQKPICDIDVGFYSSLPCIIALMAIQQGRPFAWDGKTAKAL
jgi:predicted dehydrogenase